MTYHQQSVVMDYGHVTEPCALPLSPPKGGSKREFGVAFHFFVTGHRRHFKFGMWFEHSKFQPTDDKPSRHVTDFKFLVPLIYLWNGLS